MANAQADTRFKLIRRAFRHWYLMLAGSALLALLLSMADGQAGAGHAWFAYFTVLAIPGLLLLIAYEWLTDGIAPGYLAWALTAAVVLRLLLGASLFRTLPIFGYEERVQVSGYLYQDAYTRDTDAWELSQTDQTLFDAFGRPEGSDQYGGMMFLSAAVYRYLGGEIHRPLLMSVLSAMAATLAVLLTWAFTNAAFRHPTPLVSTWVMALYPDFLLLSSSQMREPFIVLGMALSLFGYARLRKEQGWTAIVIVLAGVVFLLPISPPFAFLSLLIVGLAAVWENRVDWLGNRWVRLGLGLMGIVIALVTVRAWSAIDPFGGSPLAIVQRWFQEGARWQLFLLEEGSGWAQKVFEITPEWMHMPLATGYGVIQPFLPPALADHTGAGIWQAIAIFRSLGWAGLLTLLVYGSGAAWGKGNLRRLESYLAFVSWAAVLVASYRAAGDLWDNPRYRAALLVPQAALAGWAWAHARQEGSRWLIRTTGIVFASMIIFLHWFVGRYYGTPRLDLFETLAVIAVSWVGLIALYVYQDRRQSGA